MRLRDMKYIGFKHQRENKQNSDNEHYMSKSVSHAVSTLDLYPPRADGLWGEIGFSG
jgi:hypothetical protein